MTDSFMSSARECAEVSAWGRNPDETPGDSAERDAYVNGFEYGAFWARAHLAEQEPTDAEVEAAARKVFENDAPSHEPHEWFEVSEYTRKGYRATARAALNAARDARRDQEKR